MTTLAAEKETLGIHLSGHPLDDYEEALHTFATADTRRAASLANETQVVLGGILTRVRIMLVKTGRSMGEKMAMITLQDKHGSIDGVVFSKVFARDAAGLIDDAIVFAVGRVDTTRGEPQIIIDRVVPAAEAPLHLARRVELGFSDEHAAPTVPLMQMVAGVLQQAAASPGRARPVDLVVEVRTEGRRVRLRPGRLRVVPDSMTLERLRDLVGDENVRVVGGGAPGGPARGPEMDPMGRRAVTSLSAP
jgi:DNA polymerase-3 subunit alpha